VTARLGVISDLHWVAGPPPEASWHNPFDFAGLPERLDRALRLFADERVDAVVVPGDLTHLGDPASTEAVARRLAKGARGPVLAVAGNHDGHLEPAEELVAGVRVAGVAIEGDDAGFRWNGATLRADVLVSHFPVLSRAERLEAHGLAYPADLLNRDDLLEHLGRPVLVLSGHIHARESHAEGRVLQLSAGALVEAPYEAAIVDVHTSPAFRVRRRVHLLGPPAARDPVLAPADETWDFDGGWRCAS
jgi:predicted phosphodiesterase